MWGAFTFSSWASLFNLAHLVSLWALSAPIVQSMAVNSLPVDTFCQRGHYLLVTACVQLPAQLGQGLRRRAFSENSEVHCQSANWNVHVQGRFNQLKTALVSTIVCRQWSAVLSVHALKGDYGMISKPSLMGFKLWQLFFLAETVAIVRCGYLCV